MNSVGWTLWCTISFTYSKWLAWQETKTWSHLRNIIASICLTCSEFNMLSMSSWQFPLCCSLTNGDDDRFSSGVLFWWHYGSSSSAVSWANTATLSRRFKGTAIWHGKLLALLQKLSSLVPTSLSQLLLLLGKILPFPLIWRMFRGPTAWVYVSEIFPLRYRAKANGLCAATNCTILE